ncbi:MAG: DUF1214 domain-containing protein [Caulobacterales bacterium]
MADLKSAASPALQAAWTKYYASIEAGRRAMEATPRFIENPEHRADAYSSLIEAEAMAYNFAIAPRMDFPRVNTRSWYAYFHTLGGTSPDFYYGTLFLDGRRSYRLTGKIGELKLLLFQVYSHLLGHPQSKMIADEDFDNFTANADGTFDVIISATKSGGNWIPLDPSSNYNFIFIRRAVSDWNDERGELHIELIDGPLDYDDRDEARLAERLSAAADFLTYLVVKWNVGIYDLYLSKNDGVKNTLAVVPGSAIAKEFMGSPATIYTWGIYEIADDEALIIESDVPDAGYWSYQLMNVWCRPFDFVDLQNDINMSRTQVDNDGKFRAVISLKDPGAANWMDPSGHKEGTITGRAYHARAVPAQPKVSLVKLAELKKHLPPETKFLTPEQRRKDLEYRRSSYWNLYKE